MHAGLAELGAYFGEAPNVTESPETLLSRINAFAVSFCKACRDNDRSEHLRRKQEQHKTAQSSRKISVRPRLAASNQMLSSIGHSLRRCETSPRDAPPTARARRDGAPRGRARWRRCAHGSRARGAGASSR